MGTRNLTMVVSEGKTKIAQYGQWDGYLSGQGITVLNFLRILGEDNNAKEKLLKEHKESGWARENVKGFLHLKNLSLKTFKENVNKISFFNEEELKLLNENVEKTFQERPYLSRDVAASILWEVAKGNVDKLINNEEFAADSLFCEWAYVIDLDKNTFEIYKGYHKQKLQETERFFYLQEKCEDEDWKPVQLLHSYSLDNLPTDEEFLALGEEE